MARRSQRPQSSHPVRRFFVGILALIGFFVVLAVGVAAGAWVWLKPKPAAIADTTVLTIDLTQNLAEAAPDDPLSRFLVEEKPTLRDVVEGIDRATRDDRIKG